MASTYTYSDVWNAARMAYSKSVEPSIQQQATNLGIAKVWRAYDWRGSVVDLPPFWLVPLQQDYTNVPIDFLGLREVYIVQPNGNSPVWSPQLKVIHDLPATEVPGIPDEIGYLDKGGVFRLNFRPSSSCVAPYYMAAGTYKKQPPKITQALLMSPLPWDDAYFDVVVSGFVWAALHVSGQRSSEMEQDVVFNGILGQALGEVSRERGDNYIHPAEGVMDAYYGWNGR